MQLQLLAENTPKEKIAQVLAQYPTPYTLQPMAYDSKNGVLTFEGRHQKYGEPNSHIYQACIAPILQ